MKSFFHGFFLKFCTFLILYKLIRKLNHFPISRTRWRNFPHIPPEGAYKILFHPHSLDFNTELKSQVLFILITFSLYKIFVENDKNEWHCSAESASITLSLAGIFRGGGIEVPEGPACKGAPHRRSRGTHGCWKVFKILKNAMKLSIFRQNVSNL